MADQRDLIVRFIGEDRDLQRAFTNTERRAATFDGRMSKLNQSLRGGIFGSGIGARGALLFGSGAFIGTATITAALSESVREATALNEEGTKSREVFGGAADEIRAWAETTASSIGIARNEALRATGTFGNLFRVVGLAPQEAAQMSQALVQLAADLTSFNNANPEEVLLALRSGLIGEAEPLRRFGVLLSESRVQQEALALSGKRNVENLTNQEKTLARFNIILRDTLPAQGDFARTSEGLANQSRILRARLNDLAADLGSVLIPVLTDAAEMAGLLFDALDKFRGVDFSPGFDFPDPPSWLRPLALAPISPAGAIALTIKRALEDSENAIEQAIRPDDRAGPRGPGAIAAENVRLAIEERERQLKEAARALQRSRRQFQSFTKGMGLALDTAGLTASLDDDIRVLQVLERAILRQIEREGRTFALVEQLTQTRLQMNDLVATRAENAAQVAREAFDTMLGALDLRLDRAQATARLDDDLAVLQRIEDALVRRLATEGRTLELERRLFDIRQQQADVRRRQVQGRQFRALGLTSEGDERTPSRGTLRRRLASLREQVEGSTLDTEETRGQLRRIARVLSGEFGNVGKEVRSAIKQMFDEIAAGFDDGEKNLPRTAGRVARTRDLVRGLGLEGAELRELQQRLAKLGPGGLGSQIITGGGVGGAFGFAVPAGRGGTTIILNGDIKADSPDAFVREVEKRAKRKSGKRSGTRAGGR